MTLVRRGNNANKKVTRDFRPVNDDIDERIETVQEQEQQTKL